jgi:hypothetical protein
MPEGDSELVPERAREVLAAEAEGRRRACQEEIMAVLARYSCRLVPVAVIEEERVRQRIEVSPY